MWFQVIPPKPNLYSVQVWPKVPTISTDMGYPSHAGFCARRSMSQLWFATCSAVTVWRQSAVELHKMYVAVMGSCRGLTKSKDKIQRVARDLLWSWYGGLPKIRVTPLGVPIIRTIVYWGLYWGTLILGNYHIPWHTSWCIVELNIIPSNWASKAFALKNPACSLTPQSKSNISVLSTDLVRYLDLSWFSRSKWANMGTTSGKDIGCRDCSSYSLKSKP